MTEADRASLWQERIDDLARSGLTVEKWCELNGTTPRQYGYWRAKLRREAKPRTRPAHWVAVSVTEPVACPVAPSSLTLRIAGAEIELQAGFDPALLRSIVDALGAKAC